MDPICGRSCEASFCELNTGSCMYAVNRVPYEVGNAHTTPSTRNAAISLDGECVRWCLKAEGWCNSRKPKHEILRPSVQAQRRFAGVAPRQRTPSVCLLFLLQPCSLSQTNVEVLIAIQSVLQTDEPRGQTLVHLPRVLACPCPRLPATSSGSARAQWQSLILPQVSPST